MTINISIDEERGLNWVTQIQVDLPPQRVGFLKTLAFDYYRLKLLVSAKILCRMLPEVIQRERFIRKTYEYYNDSFDENDISTIPRKYLVMLSFYILAHNLLSLVIKFFYNMFGSNKYKYISLEIEFFPNYKGMAKLYTLAEIAEAMIDKVESLYNE